MYEHPELSNEKIANSPIDHFGIRIDNADDFLEKCKDIGVSINYGGEISYKLSSSWYVTDPSGYKIEVSYANNGLISFN